MTELLGLILSGLITGAMVVGYWVFRDREFWREHGGFVRSVREYWRERRSS